MKDKKIYLGVGIVFLLILSVSLSYAYFSASVSGNDDAKDVIVNAGTLSLVYTDGPEIKVENIRPGKTITKEVSVKNTGTLDTTYNVVWQELSNEITNNEMLVSATCERLNASGVVEGTCNAIAESAISSNTIQSNIAIESGITHQYTFTITFKEINADQNYNQGKKFSGVLGINEYKNTSPAPIYCTYDGELTTGTTFTKDGFIYRYNQYSALGNYGITYLDMSSPGWEVNLADMDSTDTVDTSKVCTYINDIPLTSTGAMFYTSKAKSIDLSKFNTSTITYMWSMFASTQADVLDISNFDTSNVTDMSYIFTGSTSTIIIGNINTSKVTTMKGMFSRISATSLDLSNLNTNTITDMTNMFEESKIINLDLSNFDTSNVTNMSGMFARSKINTLNLNGFDTSKVTDMSGMFQEMINIVTLDISSFNTDNVLSMWSMFSGSTNLKTIFASDKFNTDNVTDYNGSYMFVNCTSLVGGAGTKYNSSYVDKTYARIDGGTSSLGYFTAKNN